MRNMKDVLNVLLADHTIGQKINYLRYLFSDKAEELGYDPVTISIVATTRCTLACDMCPTHSSIVPKDYVHRQKNTNDITFDMFKEMIDRFRNAATVHIIGSGEPLLNKDFFRMVDYAAARKMTVKTFSNGTLVDKFIDNILDSGLDGMTISINGYDAKEFNRMTGMDEAVYSKIYEAVKRLVDERAHRRSKVKIKLSFILDKVNYKFIHDMIDVSLDLGVDHTFFCNFLAAPYSGLLPDERVLPADGKIADELRGALMRYPPDMRKKFTLPALVDTKSSRNGCGAHFSQVRFDGDGNVSSCSMMLLDMTGKGNYKDEDVWNNDFFKKMRRLFLSGASAELPDPCGVCPDNKGVMIQI